VTESSDDVAGWDEAAGFALESLAGVFAAGLAELSLDRGFLSSAKPGAAKKNAAAQRIASRSIHRMSAS
ncbi:MAG: hypothetical protein WAM23_02975, partial [Candidatus Acidiferrales bacterium]